MIKQSVVLGFCLLAFVRRHSKNFSFKTKIRKNELLVLLEEFPRIASKSRRIVDSLIRGGGRVITHEADDRPVMVHPKEHVKTIATMPVVVVRLWVPG